VKQFLEQIFKMSASDFSTVISNIVADDMMRHFKDLMKRILFSFTSELSKTHKISVEEVVLIWNKALPHLAYEIHVPAQSKVKKSDKDENKELKEVEEDEKEKECKCQFVLTRGKNKGETCGKKTVKGSDFCTTHNKKSSVEKEEEEKVSQKEQVDKEEKVSQKEEDEHLCKYVLTRGKNKGEKCKKKVIKNGRYCATHNKENNEEQVEKVVEKEEEKEKQEEKKEEKNNEKVVEKEEEKVVKKEEEKEKQEEKKEEKNNEKEVKKKEKQEEKKEDKNEKDLKTKVNALETKMKIEEIKKQADFKLKSVQTEKNNIGQDMAKTLLKNIEPQNQMEEDADKLTYEKVKNQMFISCKLNDDNELECKVSKTNLEKLINTKISSDEEIFDTIINIFPKGINIFYNENNEKVQKKILKLRFKTFHSVIYDYLDE